jgi:hypothetical protein
MASSLGKIPTTSVRRLISPFKRSIGFVECNLVRCSLGEGHVGKHVVLGLVHDRGELRHLRPDLKGDGAPLGAGGLGGVLGEGGGDEGGHHPPSALAGMGQDIPLKMHAGAVEKAASY